MVTIMPLGGGDEIGASCYLLKVGKTGILLDAGLRPRPQNNMPTFARMFEIVEDWLSINSVLISHPHLDHVGALPKIFERNPEVNIYVPEKSVDLIKIQILESLTKKKKDEKYTEDYPGLEYSIDLVTKCVQKLKPVAPYSPVKIPRTNVSFEFWDAGHILGSASIYINTSKLRLLYTGDISTHNRVSIPNLKYKDFNVDVLLMESTYLATSNEASPSAGFSDLYKKIKAITSTCGNVLIPCFALGKAQDIAKMFVDQNMKEKTPIPLFLDGLVKKVTQVYERVLGKENYKVIGQGKCNLMPKGTREAADLKQFLVNHPGCVILASSGMLYKNSASARWAELLLEDAKSAVFFTGFLDEESPGARLANARKGDDIEINDSRITIKAAVDKFYISTHAPPSGLISIIGRTKPKKIILVHGNNTAQLFHMFKQRAESELGYQLNILQGANFDKIECDN
nr:MBL fold metallo-hydrolase [Candidatus Sigynarchaeota archaeon]